MIKLQNRLSQFFVSYECQFVLYAHHSRLVARTARMIYSYVVHNSQLLRINYVMLRLCCVWFTSISRYCHENDRWSLRSKIFEQYKIFALHCCAAARVPPAFPDRVPTHFRCWKALPRIDACLCVNQNRASVKRPLYVLK